MTLFVTQVTSSIDSKETTHFFFYIIYYKSGKTFAKDIQDVDHHHSNIRTHSCEFLGIEKKIYSKKEEHTFETNNDLHIKFNNGKYFFVNKLFSEIKMKM